MPDYRFDPQDIPIADGYSRDDFGTDDEVRGWNLCRNYVIEMVAAARPCAASHPHRDCERFGCPPYGIYASVSCLCGEVSWEGKGGRSYVAAGVVHRVGDPCYAMEDTQDDMWGAEPR